MKKVFAVLAAFGLPAACALYIALSPFGGAFTALDGMAADAVAALGRSGAVASFLALGAVLTLAILLLSRGAQGHPHGDEPTGRASNAAPGPLWSPDSLHADDRIESRYRGMAEPAPGLSASPGLDLPPPHAPALPGEPLPHEPLPHAPLPNEAASSETAPLSPLRAAPAPLPPPVILIRKPRERDRDWFADTSWLGGLPRLGNQPWPRDSAGTPLPFVAQIDLAELGALHADIALPRTGALAFFLGEGAVIPVPAGAHDFTDPPADLPPAYDEGGQPFPDRPSRLNRWFFPFWPVQPLALELPDYLRDHRGSGREPEIEQIMAARLQLHAPLRDHPFYAAGVGAPVDTLWWHGVIHLADQLHEALDAATRPLAAQRSALAQQNALLARLRSDPATTPDDLAYALESAEELAARVETVEDQSAQLPATIAALDHFIEERDPWTPLTPEERDVVADLLAEIHERFGELVQHHVPGSLAQLATLSLRALVSGPPETLAAMPDDVLARINRDYRLPPVDQHQMFGLPGGTMRAVHRADMLLLQLGYDDMMEWSWGEGGLYQFWIAPEQAAAGNWDAARLTYEDG